MCLFFLTFLVATCDTLTCLDFMPVPPQSIADICGSSEPACAPLQNVSPSRLQNHSNPRSCWEECSFKKTSRSSICMSNLLSDPIPTTPASISLYPSFHGAASQTGKRKLSHPDAHVAAVAPRWENCPCRPPNVGRGASERYAAAVAYGLFARATERPSYCKHPKWYITSLPDQRHLFIAKKPHSAHAPSGRAETSTGSLANPLLLLPILAQLILRL